MRPTSLSAVCVQRDASGKSRGGGRGECDDVAAAGGGGISFLLVSADGGPCLRSVPRPKPIQPPSAQMEPNRGCGLVHFRFSSIEKGGNRGARDPAVFRSLRAIRAAAPDEACKCSAVKQNCQNLFCSVVCLHFLPLLFTPTLQKPCYRTLW